MTATDRRVLLSAVGSAGRDGAWLCDVRRQIPSASAARILVGLAGLVDAGLLVERSSACNVACWSLTLAGRQALRTRPLAMAA